MILLVDDAFVAELECFATLFTSEGLFPSVTQLVAKQLGVEPEDLATFFAFIALHASSMDQLWFGTEHLPHCPAVLTGTVLSIRSEHPPPGHPAGCSLSRGFLLQRGLFVLGPGLSI